MHQFSQPFNSSHSFFYRTVFYSNSMTLIIFSIHNSLRNSLLLSLLWRASFKVQMETAIESGESLNFMFSWFQKWEKNSLLAVGFRSLAAAVDDTRAVFFLLHFFHILVVEATNEKNRRRRRKKIADFTLFIINTVWSFVLLTIIPIKHIHSHSPRWICELNYARSNQRTLEQLFSVLWFAFLCVRSFEKFPVNEKNTQRDCYEMQNNWCGGLDHGLCWSNPMDLLTFFSISLRE